MYTLWTRQPVKPIRQAADGGINGRAARRLVRTGALAALWLGAAIAFAGCQVFGPKGDVEEWLGLELKTRSESVRPGQAVVVDLRLESLTDETLTVNELASRSVRFYWWRQDGSERLTRRPVTSRLELAKPVGRRTLQPGTTLQRSFVFTDMSRKKGAYLVQAFYETPAPKRGVSGAAISPAVPFRVEGDLLFSRGHDGLISKRDAVAIAAVRLARPATGGKIELVRNRLGFLEWRVRFGGDEDGNGEGKTMEVLVNPYTGAARSAVRVEN